MFTVHKILHIFFFSKGKLFFFVDFGELRYRHSLSERSMLSAPALLDYSTSQQRNLCSSNARWSFKLRLWPCLVMVVVSPPLPQAPTQAAISPSSGHEPSAAQLLNGKEGKDYTGAARSAIRFTIDDDSPPDAEARPRAGIPLLVYKIVVLENFPARDRSQPAAAWRSS